MDVNVAIQVDWATGFWLWSPDKTYGLPRPVGVNGAGPTHQVVASWGHGQGKFVTLVSLALNLTG